MSAAALPPMDLRPSLRGSGSPASIEGGGWAYRAQVDLDRDGMKMVAGPDGQYVVFDLVVSIGRDTLEMPTVSHRAGRLQYRVGRPRYGLVVFGEPGGELVRAGELGAPIRSLSPVSGLGLPLGVDLTEDSEVHHRIAVRVDRVGSLGSVRFPLRYSLVRQSEPGAPLRRPALIRPTSPKASSSHSRPLTLNPIKTHRR